jgi:hypothetical protein
MRLPVKIRFCGANALGSSNEAVLTLTSEGASSLRNAM